MGCDKNVYCFFILFIYLYLFYILTFNIISNSVLNAYLFICFHFMLFPVKQLQDLLGQAFRSPAEFPFPHNVWFPWASTKAHTPQWPHTWPLNVGSVPQPFSSYWLPHSRPSFVPRRGLGHQRENRRRTREKDKYKCYWLKKTELILLLLLFHCSADL